MKTLTLSFATLAVFSLAACGERNGPPPPEAETDGIAQTGGADALRGQPGPPAEDADELLDRVGMAADETYEPEVTAEEGASMRLDGPLSLGEWQDLGARGTGYARSGFEPVAIFRCAADETGLVVSVPAPDSAEAETATSDEAATDEAATDADSETSEGADGETAGETDAVATPPAGAAGSLITAGGTATGRFEPAEGDASSWEMLVPANSPALTGLAEGGRVGVSLEGEETRRMELSAMAVEQMSGCAPESG